MINEQVGLRKEEKQKGRDEYLIDAICDQNVDAVKELLARGAHTESISTNGSSPLHIAVYIENVTIILLLLNKGASLTSQNWLWNSPLHLAKSVAIAQLLIDKGSNINCANFEGDTPLFLAAAASNQDLMKFLIGKGANIKYTNKRDQTVLHAYLSNFVGFSSNKSVDVEILEYLFECGVPIAADRDRNSLLHACSLAILNSLQHNDNEYQKIVKFFLDKNLNLNSVNHLGDTLLHRIVKRIYDEYSEKCSNSGKLYLKVNITNCLEYLVGVGANLNIADNNGCTPLHSAVMVADIQATEFLCKQPLNIQAKNKAGKTALDVAIIAQKTTYVDSKYPAIISILNESLAQRSANTNSVPSISKVGMWNSSPNSEELKMQEQKAEKISAAKIKPQ